VPPHDKALDHTRQALANLAHGNIEAATKALEEALLDISGQMTTKELASACVCDPDIEFGYDEIIRVARKALEGK